MHVCVCACAVQFVYVCLALFYRVIVSVLVSDMVIVKVSLANLAHGRIILDLCLGWQTLCR